MEDRTAMTTQAWGDATVLVLDADGPPVVGAAFRDLIGEALSEAADWLAVPVARLDTRFWDLRSGVAGDLLQVSVNYGVRLAIVGQVPEPAASSRAFAALVRESNAGPQHWFVASIDELRSRLGGPAAG
jgi:hypothetical protein